MNVTLDVYIEGVDAPVARLTGEEGTMSFRYLTDTAQISLSLPVREAAFGDAEARAFFANLIFENEQREQVMARHGIDNDDIAGLLFHLGKDCPGAISCVPMGDAPGKRSGSARATWRATIARSRTSRPSWPGSSTAACRPVPRSLSPCRGAGEDGCRRA
ncbi:MAG: HipA N-terminal domain-containing protein [Sedimentitalea sp.]|nr:HipA N-terminal domain-containing protein [Sedimentitalea sp.]